MTLHSVVNKPLLVCKTKFMKPSTLACLLVPKTASDFSSETFSLLNPNLSTSLYSTSSVADILNSETKNASSTISTSSPQTVTDSYKLRLRSIQTSSSSSTKSTSGSISALLRQQEQPNSSYSGNLPSSLSVIPISLRPSSGIETSFTFLSYPRSTQFVGDQDAVAFLSAVNTKHSISYVR